MLLAFYYLGRHDNTDLGSFSRLNILLSVLTFASKTEDTKADILGPIAELALNLGDTRYRICHAILDAEYEQAMADGQTFSVLSTRREPTPWSGRYLVIIDSGRTSRPQWSPLPRTRQPCRRRGN